MMPKYYLKPHVTHEMLKEVGFEFFNNYYMRNYTAEATPENIFIGYMSRHISFNYPEYLIEDLPRYIQDLINLDYVEVRE